MRRVSIVLAICMLLALSACQKASNENTKANDGRTRLTGIAGMQNYLPLTGGAIEGYIQAAETEKFRLYVNTDSLAVILETTQTGERIESIASEDMDNMNKNWKGFMTSGFALEYYNDRAPTAFRVDATNGEPAISVATVDGGFDAAISYEKLGLSFKLNGRLTDTGFSAFVPAESLQDGDTAYISSLYLYPFLGATHLDSREGYILIPEGAGAIIPLNNNHGTYNSPYSKRIYGSNLGTRRITVGENENWSPKESTKILAPYFGIVQSDRSLAILATVEQGQYNAELMAYPNGVISNYNWAAVQFIMREQYSMQTTRDRGVLSTETEGYIRDIRMDYHILEGDSADYSGMAQLYRNILIESGGLAKTDTNYKTRLDFMGADAESWLLSYRAQPATTIEDMDNILDDITQQGLTNPFVVYKGWQSGGMTYNYGSGDVSVEKKLGSANSLADVAAKISNSGGRFMVYQDLLYANPQRNLNTSRNVAKGIGQMLISKQTNDYPFYSLYYTTPSWAQEIAGRLRQAFAKHDEIDFAIGSVPSALFSYYSQKTVHSRGEAADGFSGAVAAIQQTAALEQPFDYMWVYADAILDFPLYTSNYSFIGAEVPFLPMVLHGTIPYYSEYINFSPNEKEFRLKMVEYGAYPSFILTQENPLILRDTNSSYIYSSEYQIWKEQILRYDTQMKELYQQLDGAVMERHSILKKDLVRVDYSNGASLFINYSASEYADGVIIVPPQDYLLIKPSDAQKGV